MNRPKLEKRPNRYLNFNIGYNLPMNNQDGRNRKNIQVGSTVDVVQKHDQRTGKLTRGVVQRILTNSKTHPHGIKVALVSGVVGRVKKVLINPN